MFFGRKPWMQAVNRGVQGTLEEIKKEPRYLVQRFMNSVGYSVTLKTMAARARRSDGESADEAMFQMLYLYQKWKEQAGHAPKFADEP
jgi:hypothetical protein